MSRFIIAAGDPSGDLYGSLLIRSLRARQDGVRFDVAGGKLMKRALGGKDAFLYDLASMGMTGFVEPARRIPTFLRLLKRLKRLMERERPDALICIDFYGFNRRLMSAAKKAGIPVYYYISPQVWASRPGRIRKIRSMVDRMLVIFPFEEELYREAGVPVAWVGHPLLDLLPPAQLERGPSDRLRLGILPGSRVSEVRRHLPMLLKAAARIRKDYPRTEATVFAAGPIPDARYRTLMRGAERDPKVRLVRDEGYRERSRQDFVLTSSGTATLENALLGLPMVVVYKLSWPTYLLARSIIRVPYIAMANLLAGKRLVPELVQNDASPARVADAALEMLANPMRLQNLRRELAGLREKLGGPGATERAAGLITAELAHRRNGGGPA